jgi:recombination protein RecT
MPGPSTLATRDGDNTTKLSNMLASPKLKEQLALSLPKHLSADRFSRIAITALNRTPKLLDCTGESVLKCLYDLAAIGLEADGRRAHLIPYGKECTLVIDYKGIVELVRRSGEVSTIHCDVVFSNDEFDESYGTGGRLYHKPKWGDRGEPVCVYSYVKMRDGGEEYDVMDFPAVELVRASSKAANNGPWVTHYFEMAKKTIFKRHSKWLPFSSELREKIEKDDEPAPLTSQERFASAKPAKVTPFDTPSTPPVPASEQAHEPEQPAENPPPPEPTPEPEPTEANIYLQLTEEMNKTGITGHELVRFAIESRHIEPTKHDTPIEKVFPPKIALNLLRNWSRVVDEIEALRPKAA